MNYAWGYIKSPKSIACIDNPYSAKPLEVLLASLEVWTNWIGTICILEGFFAPRRMKGGDYHMQLSNGVTP